MLASYAVVLRRSAMVTGPVAVVMMLVSALVGGGKGLIGGVAAVALVAVFFGISAVVVSRAARRSPQAMMVAALTTYLVKILILLFLVAHFTGTTLFNNKLFGLTALVCILVWSGAQAVTSMRLKVPYVEPDGRRATSHEPRTAERLTVPPAAGPDRER